MSGRTENNEQYVKKTDKNKILIIILLLITVIAVGVTVWALFFRDTEPDQTPDYAPQEIDENAKSMDDDDEKLDASEGGGAVSMVYQKDVKISMETNTATLMFQNPSKSVNDVVLQLILVSKDGTDTVIAQSGKLPPGYEIETMELPEDVKLSEGEYLGKFNVLYYDPETAEKAVVNGSIEGITVTVTQ